ncbi:MAG TPA: cobyric acid synthase, partial [Rectinemataceae bacterium]|nr:cobyric acid synthase [Rectinemataceae bacterium]
EGAGSPVEINLASSDIVNMAVARLAGAPVILVADIDPGGVFAQVVGTLALLGEEDRKLVRGIVINKFRGDLSLLEPGLVMLEKLTGIPVLGVVPMLSGLALPDEDGASLRGAPQSGFGRGPMHGPEPGPRIDIAVIKLPHIANFDDFDAIAAEPAVNLRFVEDPMLLGWPDALILPGTKSTLADLAWLKASGFGDGIRWLSRIGTSVVGICGGFQMLGERIDDPDGAEGKSGTMTGLGLLSAHTVFGSGKKVLPRSGRTAPNLGGSLASLAGIAIAGYEIHSGETKVEGPAFALLDADNKNAPPSSDGSWSADGRIWGSYLHGIFGSDEFRKAWLATFGVSARSERASAALDRSIDALADAVASSLDMKKLCSLIGLEDMIIPEQGEQ